MLLSLAFFFFLCKDIMFYVYVYVYVYSCMCFNP